MHVLHFLAWFFQPSFVLLAIIWGDFHIKVVAFFTLRNFSITAITAIYSPAAHIFIPYGTQHSKLFSINHLVISL